MATYSNLSNGSSGEDVRKMQQALMDAGYDLGSSGADGIFGNRTEAAVRQYQQDNGLIVDGLAGNETLGSLYAANTAAGTETGTDTGTDTGAGTTQTTPDYSQYTYDPTTDKAYNDALAALQAAKDKAPTYSGSFDDQIKDIYDQITNRDDFSFDLNGNALYDQYKNQYINLGTMAMKDTMGQAAALTGGYGSSYGQSVGQQQFDAYLQQLNDVIPDLYAMERDAYDAETEALYDQYTLITDRADDEYNKYQDSLDRYFQELDSLKSDADTAYDRGYENWYVSQQMGTDADKTAYDRQQDAYDRLMTLITSTGYSPTATELEAAGMTESQAEAYKKYYNQQNAVSSGGSSGGGSSRGSSGKSSTSKTTTEKTTTSPSSNTKTSTSNRFADFSHSDWTTYFTALRQRDGRDAAVYQFNSLSNQGIIPASSLNACRVAAQGTFMPSPYGKQ